MGFIGGFGFAALFYAAAEYEHMTGWKWAVASLAVSATIRGLFPLSFILVLPAQFGLFCVLWWANTRHKAAREVERAGAAEADRRLRQERARIARERGPDPAAAAQEAARAAKDEAAERERKERVRLAREQREREEREAREQGGGDQPS